MTELEFQQTKQRCVAVYRQAREAATLFATHHELAALYDCALQWLAASDYDTGFIRHLRTLNRLLFGNTPHDAPGFKFIAKLCKATDRWELRLEQEGRFHPERVDAAAYYESGRTSGCAVVGGVGITELANLPTDQG